MSKCFSLYISEKHFARVFLILIKKYPFHDFWTRCCGCLFTSVSKTVLELHEDLLCPGMNSSWEMLFRAGASARYLHVFVMSDNLVHAHAAQKTFAVGISWSRFTQKSGGPCFMAVTGEAYFLFASTARALTVPSQPPLDLHPCPWDQDHVSAPPGPISPCCRTQAHMVGLPACSPLTTMPVPGHGPCWTGPWSVGCLPSFVTIPAWSPGSHRALRHPDTTQGGLCPTYRALSSNRLRRAVLERHLEAEQPPSVLLLRCG